MFMLMGYVSFSCVAVKWALWSLCGLWLARNLCLGSYLLVFVFLAQIHLHIFSYQNVEFVNKSSHASIYPLWCFNFVEDLMVKINRQHPQVGTPLFYIPWFTNLWALVLILIGMFVGTPICSARWTLFVRVKQDKIFCIFLSCLLCVFILFWTCILEIAR